MAQANHTSLLVSGGVTFDTVRLRCRVLISKKQDEYLVSFPTLPNTVVPPTFYVQPDLVDVNGKPEVGQEADATVQVILLDEDQGHGTLLVEIPGEPVSYGPKLVIPRSLVA